MDLASWLGSRGRLGCLSVIWASVVLYRLVVGPAPSKEWVVPAVRANSPESVAAGMLPGEVAEVRVSIAVVREWLSRFVAALRRVEATYIAAKAAEGSR